MRWLAIVVIGLPLACVRSCFDEPAAPGWRESTPHSAPMEPRNASSEAPRAVRGVHFTPSGMSDKCPTCIVR